MPDLTLYAVFHLNLAFSSIPKSHYPLILDRCYWPLLEVAKRLNVPLGIEATGYTLEIIEAVDASFIDALKSAWKEKTVEFIGSSYSQSIFPLCPAEVNQHNLKLGNTIYQTLLGNTPKTAYVNEQTYSTGLVDLYLEAGYEHLFMEWNNPARYHAYPEETRYRPQKALNPDGSQAITLIWNDSIAFQKLQRVLNQSLTMEDYLNDLQSHIKPGTQRGYPFYGSDAEVIDYHPGHLEAEYLQSTGSHDLQRLVKLIERLQENTAITWKSPSDFATSFTAKDPPIRLESAEYPLPCKKQPKYNPTRWAVTGREDTLLNTLCYERYFELATLNSCDGDKTDPSLWRFLLEKWGSDFRTHTTDEKQRLLRQRSGNLERQLDEALSMHQDHSAQKPLTSSIWNPNKTPYTGPILMEVQFSHKALKGHPTLAENPALQALQLEGIGYYQDGSVRWLKALMMVTLPAKSRTDFHWESGEIHSPQHINTTITPLDTLLTLKTDAVTLACLPQRGGAIQSLQFNQLDTKPWAGTLPHGYFEDIGLGADFYSGHFILASKGGEKATDLSPGKMFFPENPDNYPIRLPIQMGLSTEIGSLWKTYHVYRHLPRVDLHYHFRFRDISAASCRVGILTILPEAFDRNTLAYTTVNGGIMAEHFPLSDRTVTHSEPVNITVSSQHGLGATQGWVAVEDKDRRLILKTYPHHAYAMPMIHYQESKPGYFLRVMPSIGEFDDTSHTLWRGHHEVMFSWIGQQASESVYMPLPPVSFSANTRLLPV